MKIMKFKELLKLIKEDGWFEVRVSGSHKQFKHSINKRTVTVAGKVNKDIPKGTLNNILKQAALKQIMEYIIVIEKSKNGFGAYSPDLQGVGVVGDTRQEVIKSIKKAIKMHLADITDTGSKIPKPTTEVLKLEVA